MASIKSYRKNKTHKRKHAKKHMKKHMKKNNKRTGKKTRRNTRRHRRQRQHVRHFHRGGSAVPFPDAKPWNPVDGGNYFELNKNAGTVDPPISARYENMGSNASLEQLTQQHQTMSLQNGGRRSRKVRKGRKQRKSRGRKQRKSRGRKSAQKLHYMRGGQSCPSCPNTSGVGPEDPSLSDFVPPPLLKAWRTGVNGVNNLRHGFNGEHFARDGPNITNQPIGKKFGSSPEVLRSQMPLDVSGIYTDSQQTAGTI